MTKRIVFIADNDSTEAVDENGNPDIVAIKNNPGYKYQIAPLADRLGNVGYDTQTIPIYGDKTDHKSAVQITGFDEAYIFDEGN